MTPERLAGSPGPHAFVDSMEHPVLDELDRGHFERSLRMRAGDALTFSDARGGWCTGVLGEHGVIAPTGETQRVTRPEPLLTVAFSLVKGNKPEVVVQKLTELGVDRIIALAADRSVVRWDEAKAAKACGRWERIAREAAMQSHRVWIPEIVGVVGASTFLSEAGQVALAHFDGAPVDATHHTIAIGPEGGWSDQELAHGHPRVALGDTVLRAETAAISAGVLLCAARRTQRRDVG